jgi:hypothetical protein
VAQLAHEPRDNYLVRLCLVTQAGSELHRCAEKIVMIRHRLTGVDADPHPQNLDRSATVRKKVPLDIGAGTYRVRHLVECGHDAVARVLDLTPPMRGKAAPHECVVHPNQLERRSIAETRRHLGRADDVGEHNGAQPGIHLGGRGTRRRFGIADTAEERLDCGKINRDDVGRDLAMSLAMDPLGGGRVGCVNQQNPVPRA